MVNYIEDTNDPRQKQIHKIMLCEVNNREHVWHVERKTDDSWRLKKLDQCVKSFHRLKPNTNRLKISNWLWNN